jgi:tellurite methyltransferase
LSNQIKDKWDKHYRSCSNEIPTPAEVLLQYQHLLPNRGTALDLASGRGANALYLAEHGLNTSAWDISSSALDTVTSYAKEKDVIINTEERDVVQTPPKANSFDVIVVSRFLDRGLIPHIKNAIKNYGLIFYQTFTKDKVDESGPSNPDYLLDKNELLHFFNDWKLIVYREEGTTGNKNIGFRNQAMIIAQKIS